MTDGHCSAQNMQAASHSMCVQQLALGNNAFQHSGFCQNESSTSSCTKSKSPSPKHRPSQHPCHLLLPQPPWFQSHPLVMACQPLLHHPCLLPCSPLCHHHPELTSKALMTEDVQEPCGTLYDFRPGTSTWKKKVLTRCFDP